MTNKELQDLLKQFPDDMPIYLSGYPECDVVECDTVDTKNNGIFLG